jgi:hypothetical protein
LTEGQIIGVVGGLISGCMGIALASYESRNMYIDLVSLVSFSPSTKDNLYVGLAVGLVVGLGGGLAGGVVFGLISGLVFWLVSIGFGGLSTASVNEHDLRSPGQGVRESLYSALLIVLFATLSFDLYFGIYFGLVVGLFRSLVIEFFRGGIIRDHIYSADAVVVGVAIGVAIGMFFWLVAGVRRVRLTVSVQHYVLMRLLAYLRCIPPHYVRFLDFAADHVLLQRVGGGYRFVHALLLDYFADQWPGLSAQAQKPGR